MGFATGAIAAVTVGSLAGLLLVIKFICVITGWERRIPRLREPRDVENRLLTAEAQSIACQDPRSNDDNVTEEQPTNHDGHPIDGLGQFTVSLI